MAIIEKTCYSCTGRGFHESWTGRVVACPTCNGSRVVMEPDEDECRRMMRRALEPPEIMKHPDETDAEFKIRALEHHRSKTK
jgi:hypothetical protein